MPEYRRNHRLEPMAQLEVRLFMKEPAAVAARGCRFNEETAWKRMQTYDSALPPVKNFFFAGSDLVDESTIRPAQLR